jgi:hypothetical protein
MGDTNLRPMQLRVLVLLESGLRDNGPWITT